MIASIFIIDILIVTFFEWGIIYYGVGLLVALIYFFIQQLKQKMKAP